jgi:hypothetical protein
MNPNGDLNRLDMMTPDFILAQDVILYGGNIAYRGSDRVVQVDLVGMSWLLPPYSYSVKI